MAVDVKVATERAQARIGSVIKDKWRLERLLGVGGMACVYAATHRNKKRAAVKMLHREYSTDSAIRERFMREGYLANSVGHRGAVTVDDDDVAEDGTAYIVMELLDGETLEHRWRRKAHRLPLEEALAIADQVLDTLAAAHDKGVVHRDLKPENLFLTREGVVKLLDFGIGRLKELNVSSNTLAGAAMGTPAFMAPEQARGRWQDVDGQTDLWALGSTLFTLLTGAHVHEGLTVNETLALASTQRARSITTLRPDLPAHAAALVDRALSYGKPQRFADARAMQAEVRRVYATLSGGDVRRVAQLSIPDGEPVASAIRPEGGTDPRLRLTMARAVPASDRRAPFLHAWARPRNLHVLLASGAAILLLVVGALARSYGSEDEPVAAVPLAPPPAPAVAPQGVPSTEVPEAASVPPLVSIEELPREPSKRPGQRRPVAGSAPPTKSGARRR